MTKFNLGHQSLEQGKPQDPFAVRQALDVQPDFSFRRGDAYLLDLSGDIRVLEG